MRQQQQICVRVENGARECTVGTAEFELKCSLVIYLLDEDFSAPWHRESLAIRKWLICTKFNSRLEGFFYEWG